MSERINDIGVVSIECYMKNYLAIESFGNFFPKTKMFRDGYIAADFCPANRIREAARSKLLRDKRRECTNVRAGTYYHLKFYNRILFRLSVSQTIPPCDNFIFPKPTSYPAIRSNLEKINFCQNVFYQLA